MNVVDTISRKRDGRELSTEEIRSFVSGIASGSIPDYQAAAWLMAVYLRGMCERETIDLTLAMRDSGARVDLSDMPNGPSLDKHSTGGIGDKTSLVVVPVLAAGGVPVFKMSGRGLGYSGGTVDKLESIPGFRTTLSIDVAKSIVRSAGAVMIAQSNELAPADKLLYSLRDVTATVESIPLIAASIMSKKLAAGGQRIVLDVKCGSGSFMKTRSRAEELARQLVSIGTVAGVPTVAVISSMEEPLGYAVGNAVEVREAIETLQGLRFYECVSSACGGFLDLCLELAARGFMAVGKAANILEGRARAHALIASGSALQSFVRMVRAQGGPVNAHEILEALPVAAERSEVSAAIAGYVTGINAEIVGRVAVELGAGRETKLDTIDHSVGILLHAKVGSMVEQDGCIATMLMRKRDLPRAQQLRQQLREAFRIGAEAPAVTEVILGTVEQSC